MTVTFASGTSAPLESLTVPTIVPLGVLGRASRTAIARKAGMPRPSIVVRIERPNLELRWRRIGSSLQCRARRYSQRARVCERWLDRPCADRFPTQVIRQAYSAHLLYRSALPVSTLKHLAYDSPAPAGGYRAVTHDRAAL